MGRIFLFCLLLSCSVADSAPRQISDHRWADVDRIVAIGDLHGDYDNYMATLRAAGIVDRRGRWADGNTHLVQTGDIPDRGPDTKKIIEHMAKLARQARRDGGRVHNLIGNHEAMNVYGDLRYVIEEEFEAFATSRSEQLRERYFDAVLEHLESNDPERFSALPDDFRAQWNEERPLGWVEHRQAWDPEWNPEGEMYEWVSNARVAIQINDTIFVHGGISGHYCRDTLLSMTERAQDDLERGNPDDDSILTDQFGPLWYRGLAGVAPEAPSETVDAILENHQAKRIVIGHTPTGGIIWPRYEGRVIQIDTGISSAYGGHVAYLEITPKGLVAGYLPGEIELQPGQAGLEDYLSKVVVLLPDNDAAREKLAALRVRNQEAKAEAGNETAPGSRKVSQTGTAPICGTRL